MRSILGTGPPDTMHCLRLHDTPAVAVRGHFPQQRQRLPASVLSGNEWNSGVVPQFLATENRSGRAVVISGKRLSPESTAIN